MPTYAYNYLLVALKNDEGQIEDGTYRLTDGALVPVTFTRGYQVATHEVYPAGVVGLEEGDMIGVWTNAEGRVVIDFCSYIDGSEILAIAAGQAFAQDAIWDWQNLEAITL